MTTLLQLGVSAYLTFLVRFWYVVLRLQVNLPKEEEAVVFAPKLVPKTDPADVVVAAPNPPKLGALVVPKPLLAVFPS